MGNSFLHKQNFKEKAFDQDDRSRGSASFDRNLEGI